MKGLSFLIVAVFISNSLFAQNDKAPTPTPQWRPEYHFTPEKNWTNDPNGLIYYKGQYHLYNQQNPFENVWGHMSWGHATSKDLLHFTQHPIAIPEKIHGDTTDWRFSGCTVYDEKNTSGLCKNGGCLVAVYTNAQPNQHNQSQWIAYSNDDGMSYANYEGNPVIDLKMADFRDPSVRWNEQLNQWVMVVALPHEHSVQFYSSPNLKDWTLLSEFGKNEQGFHDRPWECPFLVQLPVDGNKNKKKWVLFVSSWGPKDGPWMQYFVGDFDGKTFTNDNPGSSYLSVDEGNTFYAAIPFNNQPQGKEIMVGWMVPLKQATFPWRGQFSIPRDLGLKTTPEGIRLVQQPASVIQNTLPRFSTSRKKNWNRIQLDRRSFPLDEAGFLDNNTNWIEAVFTPGTASNFGFTLTQSDDKATFITYTPATNELKITPISGEEIHPLTAIVKPVNGKIKLQVLLDKSSLEVFANDGEKVITTLVFPPENATGLSVYAENGNVTIQSLKTYDLRIQ